MTPKKMMVTVWWSRAGVIHHSFLPNGMSIAADVYCEELITIMGKLARLQPALVNRSAPLLLHDNARPHTAQQTICKLQELGNSTIKTDTAETYQRISDYYAGKSVFLTGGTGFLGKVLIERLLSTCTDIDSIYVLIRGKRGMNAEQRQQQITDVPVRTAGHNCTYMYDNLFDKLKSLKPNTLKKIIAIEGDVTRPEPVVRTSDQQKLIDNVSVVIHSAATVNFSDTFRDTMTVNYEGTKKLVHLAKKIKNLETFVYISTAFANSDKMIVDEVMYPRLRTEEEVDSFIDVFGDDEQAVEKFLCGSPNKYTLSKALCENYLQENRGSMKTIIIRPSIVTPTLGDPLPGWCDSWVAATALFSDVARGLTRAVHGHRGVVCDLVPADLVCHLAIVAAARGNR
ncbi:putative fatty acyl-CoA reductase CG5065 [Melitaea cinxia]|uniref:putative fatty acyl-CoA reductase CG5065 n=1 Tax=Melitaea cinxia TaxID=113334 RepID=UPI001E2735F2|nr:putative fatty acyl-CoA reductase CG5065 [Melitaea cinxia]